MLFDGSRPWLDPAFTSLNRLPIRPALVPCPDLRTARRHDPAASPWWVDLDGTWDFTLLGSPEMLTPGHLSEVPPEGDIEVPAAWTLQGHGPPHYTNVMMPFGEEPPAVPEDNPTGVYRRTVVVPGEWKGRRSVLRVGAAESMVFVYLDGHAVGASTDSRLPAEFDLTRFVRPGRRHTLALVVLKWSAATWLEDQDQWWHAGLQRGVSLYSTAASHLMTVVLRPDLADVPEAPLRADRPVTGRLAVDLGFDGPIRREPGWTAEVTVESLRGTRVAGTGRVEVGFWNDESIFTRMVGAMFAEPGVMRAELEVPEVLPWSAESPTLYRAVTTLRDPAGSVVEVVALKVGFRHVEVGARELRVNGAPVILRGVNVHEHDPLKGRSVSRELATTDLRMVKAANLNAVRGAHYPHDEHFAELCDELGLYLVDEANIETHARQQSLSHDPRFAAPILERVERMARRDVHHPSVIVWSLGNESGYSHVHDAAAAWLRAWDPSRPVQYEGPFMHDLFAAAPASDVVCPMYTGVDGILSWAETTADTRRPLILCEYSHAMGNAGGSILDYDDAFEHVEGLQGGFIWEWLEHGIPLEGRRGPAGGPSWGYGGDFGDEPNDASFVCDGLVSAGRVPHPLLDEVRWLGRPVRVVELEQAARGATVVLRNQRWFTDTSDLEARWELTADGEVTAEGEIGGAALAPRALRSVKLRWPAKASRPGAEHLLTIRWRLGTRVPWARKGEVVGWEQRPLPMLDEAASHGRARHTGPEPAPLGRRTASEALPEGCPGNFTPTLFRALTDNDGIRTGWMRGFNGSLGRWVGDLGLDACEWDDRAGELRPGGDAPAMRVSSEVTDLDDGWSRLVVHFELPPALADPPRLGVHWVLPGDFERLEWFGDGPSDSYPDRRGAALVGRWRSNVSEQYVDYGMPQEHGHHGGLRWLSLSSPARGLIVVADGSPGFSARHHSDEELWRARHTHDLASLADAPWTHLSVDVAQRGLGQSSLGAEAGAAYRIPAGHHRLELLVRALGRREDPARLYAHRPR
jgi:beta-galactosidase